MTFIEHMEAHPEDSDFLDKFFNTFGTHVVKGVDMGDKFVSRSKFSRKEMYRQMAMGYEVGFDASTDRWTF